MARRHQLPDRLPPAVRDHSEVVRACHEWNIGRLFRVVNNLTEEPAKFTVTHIGRLCGLSVSRVGEYMKDAHRVTAVGIIERIADGLHIPGERFGLTPRPWEPSSTASKSRLTDFQHLDDTTSEQLTTPPIRQLNAELVLSKASAAWAMTPIQTPANLAALLMQYLESLAPSDSNAFVAPRDYDYAFDQLVQFLTGWAHNMNRRELLCTLRTLSWATAAASIVQAIDLEEQERVASVLSKPSRFRLDATMIEHIETVLWSCQRQDDKLGPQAALDTVLAQRNLARALLRNCPASLRPRMLSVLSNASRHAGWLSFDLNNFDSARYYYEDARALAHEAENIELSAFVLCNMSHLATWQRKPRIGVDYAVAAGEWAKRTDDVPLQAYAADVAARAYAADGQSKACLAALDAAGTALTMTSDPQYSGYVYFYDEGLHTSTRCSCHLELHEPQRAANYAEQSLKTLDRSYTRNVALATVNLGLARVQCHEIDEAACLLGDAGEIAAYNSSARLIGQVRQVRAGMESWQHTTVVRTLDDRLVSYGLT